MENKNVLKLLKELKNIGHQINQHNGIGRIIIDKVDIIIKILYKKEEKDNNIIEKDN